MLYLQLVFWEIFEFSKVPKCSFSGKFFGPDQFIGTANLVAVSRMVFLFFLLDLEFWLFCTKNRYFYARLTRIYKGLSVRTVLRRFESFTKLKPKHFEFIEVLGC